MRWRGVKQQKDRKRKGDKNERAKNGLNYFFYHFFGNWKLKGSTTPDPIPRSSAQIYHDRAHNLTDKAYHTKAYLYCSH